MKGLDDTLEEVVGSPQVTLFDIFGRRVLYYAYLTRVCSIERGVGRRIVSITLL